MRAAVIDQFGADSELVVREVPVPSPGPAQILIEVHSASVNPIDWKIRDGQMAQRYGSDFPLILGFDCSGVVAGIGTDVTEFTEGDEVFARSDVGAGGCYAEYAVLNAATVARKPAGMTHEEAASIPLAGLTAINGFRECAAIGEGDRVLVIGASGGVGSLAVQIARNMGAVHVTGVCSTQNIELVASLGVDHIIDYTVSDPFETEVPYNIVYDTVGAHSHAAARKALAEGGTYLTLVPGPDSEFFVPGQTIREPGKGYFVTWTPTAADLRLLADWASTGKLRTVIDSMYPLSDIRLAHLRSQTERAVGKIVIRMVE
jgi:NADPH:quinone reductase-like Zn-dependent oxidoreductase